MINIKPEVFFNKETRFDFLIEKNKQKIFVEVKNVTLFRDKKLLNFLMQLHQEDLNIYLHLLMP